MAINIANASRIIRLVICTVLAIGFVAQSGSALANIHADVQANNVQDMPNKPFSFHRVDIKTINTSENFFRSNNKTTLTASLFTSHKQTKASSAAEAAQIAKQRHGGKVLSVDTVKTANGVNYRVKLLLDNGRVKTVTING